MVAAVLVAVVLVAVVVLFVVVVAFLFVAVPGWLGDCGGVRACAPGPPAVIGGSKIRFVGMVGSPAGRGDARISALEAPVARMSTCPRRAVVKGAHGKPR